MLPYDKIKKDFFNAALGVKEVTKGMKKFAMDYAKLEELGIKQLCPEQMAEKQQMFEMVMGKKEMFKKIYGADDTILIQVEGGQECEPVEEAPQIPFMSNRQEEMLVWYPRKNHMHGGGEYDDGNLAMMDPIRHFNTQDLLARFFIETHARWGVINNWRQNVIGITSMYRGASLSLQRPGGAHMPMLDYDGKNVRTQIRKDVKLFQKEHGLGDAWVYETRGGFHVYFFTDIVGRDEFLHSMLEQAHCCEGYKRASLRRGYSILRVSAKYTDFDIVPLYVLAAKRGKLRRMTRKAHTIKALIDLGTKCGTHFASMYPQWAHFQQDVREWKPIRSDKKPMPKRIRRVARSQLESVPQMVEPKGDQWVYNHFSAGNAITSSTTTSISWNWLNANTSAGSGNSF